jgi:hypothetical protein
MSLRDHVRQPFLSPEPFYSSADAAGLLGWSLAALCAAIEAEKLAGRDALSVDEVLSQHLLDLVGAESEWLGVAIAGFDAALRWPEA